MFFFTRFYLFFSVLSFLFGTTYGQSVRINEVMSSNSSVVTDEDDTYQDWVEIFNEGDTPVNLDGFGLSDNPGQPLKWTFPDVTIEPGEYLLVWASNKDRKVPGSPLHTNFAIGAEGEEVLLSDADGNLLDEAAAVAIPTDLSYGRQPDGSGTWYFFDAPTPGSTNTTSTGYESFLDPPTFSHEGGFYTDPFTLTLSSSDPAVTILYTVDGSDPDADNTGGKTYNYKNQYPEHPGSPVGELLEGSYETLVYSTPLDIADRSTEPDRLTGRSSTYHETPWYAPASPVFKGTVVRARAVRAGYMPSEVVTNTYFVTPEGEARYTLPVVSVTLQENFLFGYEEGIYNVGKDFDDWRIQNPGGIADGSVPANYQRGGDEFEYPGHLEIFDPQSGIIIDQRMGLRIHGGWSRSAPNKSLRLYARNEYGKSHFDHALFPDMPFTEYKRILLRNSGTDRLYTFFRDAAIHALASSLVIDRQAYRPSIAFLNGEYWGLLNMRERYDNHYLSRTYGVDEENVDILENGVPDEGDADHYNAMISYVTTNPLSEDAHYEQVETMMDIDNFIDYQIIQIFSCNTDWPANNVRLWRLRMGQYQPGAPYGHDGRWRWMLYDTDYGFGLVNPYTYDMLSFATESNGPSWPNPPWSTLLFRRLLENDSFKTAFIRRFDDMLNSAFLPDQATTVINEMKQAYEPEMAEHIARWKSPANMNTWEGNVNVMLEFVQQRPAYQRQHIRDYFGLEDDIALTVNVSDPQHGHVRVNSIDIKNTTAGIGETPYPFSGTYFRGMPMELEAVPAPGYRFAGWAGIAGESARKMEFVTESDLSLTAHFVPGGSVQLIHYWNFNEPDALTEPTYSEGGAAIAVNNGPDTEVLDGSSNGFSGENARLESEAGSHLRVNNPLGSRILFKLPTTGYKDIVLKYETRRSGQGAGIQVVEYSIDGEEFLELGTIVVIDGSPTLYEFDLTEREGVSDNPDFTVRIAFEQGVGGIEGNNRFDNLTLDGLPVDGAGIPPVVAHPIGLIALIENGTESIIDLDTVFMDIDSDALTFTVTNGNPNFADLVREGNILKIGPLRTGDATITIQADDGETTPAAHIFRVLIYPEALPLNDGDFVFDHWDSDLPEWTYPPNMIFLQSDVDDPGVNYPLLYPYYIAHDDYHDDDEGSIGFPYNNTGRSRLNGLGEEGISFINTGRARDLGGALVSVNTGGLIGVEASWLCGTILQNSRVYGINLQYRIGAEGDFVNIPDDSGETSYVTTVNGHINSVSGVRLPDEVLDQPYVQLLWRYHHISGTSGPRAELRLDDILLKGEKYIVSTDNEILGESRAIYPNPVNDLTSVRFTLNRESYVKIAVNDMMGRPVTVLVDERMSPGSHERPVITAGLAQGSYIVTIQTEAGATQHKIVK